jgi:two-component system chemotaxis response regulator CheB
MVVDDSVVIRSAMTRLLETEPDIRVVARAADGRQAIDALTRNAPDITIDVVLLDIEMPVLDGLATLPLLLRAAPGLRVVMASTLTTRGAEVTLQALKLGAADYIAKPVASELGQDSFRRELLAKVRGLGRRPVPPAIPSSGPAPRPPAPPRRPEILATGPLAAAPPRLLAIGSSTGGPQALFALTTALGPGLSVPVVLAQHMPATFTPMLAAHLDRLGAMPCAEARPDDALQPGRMYLAPGGQHLVVVNVGGTLRARLSDAPPENFCRPSVDVLLRSAAEACQGRVLVVMLTGMGQDGLLGTRAVIAAGGSAVAQDEATSVVWGMPGAIAQAGLCRAVLPLPQLAGCIRSIVGGGSAARSP